MSVTPSSRASAACEPAASIASLSPIPGLNTACTPGVNLPFTSGLYHLFMRVVDRVIEESKRRGWSRADLARQLQISPQRLHNWQARDIPPASHKAVAKALGWTVDRLVYGGQAQSDAVALTAQSELERAALLALRGLTLDQQREAIASMQRAREANLRIVSELSRLPGAAVEPGQQMPPPRRERPPLMPYPEPFGPAQTKGVPTATLPRLKKRTG